MNSLVRFPAGEVAISSNSDSWPPAHQGKYASFGTRPALIDECGLSFGDAGVGGLRRRHRRTNVKGVPVKTCKGGAFRTGWGNLVQKVKIKSKKPTEVRGEPNICSARGAEPLGPHSQVFFLQPEF